MKRMLYLSHRWLGIILCLFMAMWFVSGIVMLYVGYPKLTPAEHLAHLPPLASDRLHIDLAQALQSTGKAETPDTVRLTSINAAPRFVFGYGKTQIAVDGETGEKIVGISTNQALTTATGFLVDADAEYLGKIDEDPWTHSRALDPHRPLHRVQMADTANTLLYISDSTGEVVRDAPRQERLWNWIGSWLHWLYPFRGGVLNAYAADIIIYSALAGSLLSLVGLSVGLLRWRFSGHYRRGGKSPYRDNWLRWHHLTGLVFGLFTLTWVASGLFSMNPWKMFDSGFTPNVKHYQGGDITPMHFVLPVPQAIQHFQNQGFKPCELEWRLVNGNAYYLAMDAAGHSRLIAANGLNTTVFERIDWQILKQAAQAMLAPAQPSAKQILQQYDFYYYARAAHTMTGHIEKRLPVLRLEFNDSVGTWLQIDPYTGDFQKLDRLKRLSRVLFGLLHSWDWLPLLGSRPLWDGLMIFFSLGGFMLSLFGAVIAWRRLRIKFGSKKSTRAAAHFHQSTAN